MLPEIRVRNRIFYCKVFNSLFGDEAINFLNIPCLFQQEVEKGDYCCFWALRREAEVEEVDLQTQVVVEEEEVAVVVLAFRSL